MLENVRNIAGPRHTHEWQVIIRSLRDLGYRVSSQPVVFSPHLVPPERGGRPQIRERVFILGTYVGKKAAQGEVAPSVEHHRTVDEWSPQDWSLRDHIPVQSGDEVSKWLRLNLTPAESTWVDAWNDFVVTLRRAGVKKLPGFPIWEQAWVLERDLVIDPETPAWKANFLRKNAAFYTEHETLLESWLERWDYLQGFPASRRKFEWQAQGAVSLDETIMHLRPSGLRAKRATYVPALVAITQTSILGDVRRRLSPREAARLQSLPEWFDFGDQPDAATYKQMGNGVNAGAAYYVIREHIRLKSNLSAIERRAPHLAAAAQSSPDSPDEAIERHWDKGRPVVERTRMTPGTMQIAG
jgi:DNA (cytosine-5)-methyltransferase 1